MHYNFFKRRAVYLPLIILGVLALLSAIVFNPGLQKKVLLDQVGPWVDSIEIGDVHITPWSTQFDAVTVGYAGGSFRIESGRIRYGLSSLVLKKLNVKSVSLQGVRVDLTNFNPPEATGATPDNPQIAAPFPGLLAALDAGFSYVLGEVDVDAQVRLPAGRAVTAKVTGGGVRPEASGQIGFEARFETGAGDDHVSVDGSVRLDQLTRGRFSAIETGINVKVALASLPQAERVAITLQVKPAPGQSETGAAATAKGQQRQYAWESIALSLEQNDDKGRNRAALELNGNYDGNTGQFAGGYRIIANEQLVQPYAADMVVAPAREVLTGELALNIASLTGDMTVTSELLVTDISTTYANEQLPERLRLQNNFRISLLPERHLRVERLETGLSRDDDVTALTSSLVSNLDIPLNDIGGFLKQENTLLEFELPGVPLAWLNILLPDYAITAGSLNGAFAVTTDSAGTIHLKPKRPLKLVGMDVSRGGAPFFAGVNAALSPSASYSGNSLSVALNRFELRADENVLLTADIGASLPLSEPQSGSLDASVRAQLQLRNLARFLGTEPDGMRDMPETLALNFDAGLLRQSNGMHINRLDADLATNAGGRLVKLALLQPLVLEQAYDGLRVANAAGKLASFNVSDIDLGWFSGLVSGGSLEGALRRADFTLAVGADGTLSVTPEQPFRMAGVTLTASNRPLLDDLSILISPAAQITTERIDIQYQDLELVSDGAPLVTGSGTVTLPRAVAGSLAAEGRLDIDLQRLARQPLVAGLLQAGLNEPVRLDADYRLSRDADGVDISRLTASVYYSDPQPKMTLLADSGIRVRTRLAANKDMAEQARGELTLTVTDLTPAPFADILAAHGLSFANANGKAVLSSDGRSMRVATDGPFDITGIAVRSEDAALLAPFALNFDTRVDIDGATLSAVLDSYRVTFDGASDKPAVQGNARLTLDGDGNGEGGAVRLSSLSAEMSVALPAVLSQPALLPGHKLKSGDLKGVISVTPDGRIDSTLRLDGLKARTALPLQTVEATVTGTLEPGGGFTLTAPVTTTGKSGVGDLQIQALRGVGRGLSIAATSSVLYLNDILTTLNTIAGRQPAATDAPAPGVQPQAADAPGVDDRLPDPQPFWSGAGENVHLSVDIERLFYTDYLVIKDISAVADVLPEKLALERFNASFHNSPIAAGGTLGFTGGATPYDLKLQGSVGQLDLATLFRELAPGAKPRAEGLFDFSIDAFGQSPNMPQYRNNLYFDMQAQSRDGIFRLLDPDSPIVASSTGLSGALGEVVSYVPTGLFGLGAVSRLVSYIKEVEYDMVDVQLVRDASRDVQIRRFVVQSPEVLMTARGGVEYQEGVDILQSPLTLDAQLDLRGEGAAIMYDMNLLESERNRWNYWKGPQFRFRGTLATMESNLPEVISQAGSGMVLGGVARPVSGLIGNVRHRWSRDKKPPLEYDGSPADGAADGGKPPRQTTDSDEANVPPDGD